MSVGIEFSCFLSTQRFATTSYKNEYLFESGVLERRTLDVAYLSNLPGRAKMLFVLLVLLKLLFLPLSALYMHVCYFSRESAVSSYCACSLWKLKVLFL